MLRSVRELVKVDSIKLASYIAQKTESISHLKLQKILFYRQAYHLGYFNGKPLIDDDFQAWLHGPVSEKLYDVLKDKSILHSEVRYIKEESEEDPEGYLKKKLTIEQVDSIDDVIQTLKNKTGFELETLTHNELPWINAGKGVPASKRCDSVMPKPEIAEYYGKLIND